MATVIDTLFMELGIDSSKFSREAKQAVSKLDDMTEAFEKAEAKTGKSGKGLDKHAEKVKQNVKQAKNLTEAMGKVAKGAAALFALVTGSNALDKLIREAAEANVQLDNLSRNIGMSRNQLQAWGGMAEMAGGQADAMRGSLAGLSMSITRLTTMGDTSMVPFFNAFGVALLNADGKARNLDSIMLDLADRFSKMDRVQAYNLAKSMGLDDGTINTLLLGRAEMEKMLALQDRLYRSGEKEIAVSRELTRSRAYLNQQWDALKNMIADALAPHLLRLVKLVSSFADYLMRNENTMKHVFEGLAFVLGVVLIPVLWSAVTALYAFIAPFALAAAAVVALGAAFILLYDDYKTWAEGGKSLFDWGAFTGYIRTSKVSVDSLTKGFTYLLTGYTSWAEAGKGLFDWLRLKGFIDENGVSLRSLANGFKSLANDIYQSVAPALEDLGEIFNALMNRDYNRAWTAAKRLAMRPVNFVADQVQSAAERVSGAVDVATGHTPGAAGSAQAVVRDIGRMERMANQAVSSTSQTAVRASQETTRAAQYAMERALPASAGKCALHVNNSLRAQGIKVYGHGKDVADNLIRSGQGFQQVKYDANYVPQDGDVMSIDHGRHKYGHVAIYNARRGKWVSDFVQHRTRGNTAAANDADFRAIQSGRARVTIARRSAPESSRQSMLASAPSAMVRDYGDHQKIGGSRAWRNNNEGNIRYGRTARRYGAIGKDQNGFAIFPTAAHGHRAKEALLFESDTYRNLSLMQAIEKYAPPSENDTAAYQRRVLAAVGGNNIRMGSATPAQRQAIMQAMRQMEGWKEGEIRRSNMNQPIGGQAVADNAQRGLHSMQQGAVARQQAQQITNNSNMQFAINGGIHVQSSANTIDGTMEDASAAARNRLVQIMPAMV